MLINGIDKIAELNEKIYEYAGNMELCLIYGTDSYSEYIKTYDGIRLYDDNNDDIYDENYDEKPIENILVENINDRIKKLEDLKCAIKCYQLIRKQQESS